MEKTHSLGGAFFAAKGAAAAACAALLMVTAACGTRAPAGTPGGAAAGIPAADAAGALAGAAAAGNGAAAGTPAADAAQKALEEALDALDPAETLAAFAEFERSRGFITGVGLAESTLLEKTGDYAGAVMAAFKELYWIYGGGGMARDETTGRPVPMTAAVMRRGMEKVAALYSDANSSSEVTAEGKKRAIRACNAVFDFVDGRYAQAGKALDALFAGAAAARNGGRNGGGRNGLNGPDDFPRWMRIVCSLEEQKAARRGFGQTQAEYSAIRARYSTFPAYWYYAMRAATANAGTSAAFATEFAERCINLAPEGPFAKEARETLAVCSGLSPQDGAAMLTKSEIEEAITDAIKNADPSRLEALMPLAALGDNNWTAYATGAMRALASVEPYRSWFNGKLAEANARRGVTEHAQRLAGRLDYIARGNV